MISPQLATPAASPPDGDEWIHEIKYDGFRAIADVHDGRARIWSRGGTDYSDRVPTIAEAALALCPEITLDGELVVMRPDGRSDFQALQRAIRSKRFSANVTYRVWDLLRIGEEDLRPKPLLERKRQLAQLLADAVGPIAYVDHIVGQGPTFYEVVCEKGLEGIVSKRASSPYKAGSRSRSWLKTKCWKLDDFVVTGWSDEETKEHPCGSLLVARRRPDGSLAPVGRVGLGHSHRQAHLITQHLRTAERPTPPLRTRVSRDVHWIEPIFTARVRFLEITQAGQLRHATLQQLTAGES